MRRSDRQVTDPAKIKEILSSGEFCTLALMDGDRPYALPLSYGYELTDEGLNLYFHAAIKGKKLCCIAQNGNAAFSIALALAVDGEGEACTYTRYYRSVMGQGSVSLLEDAAERHHAMSLLMKQHGYTGKMEFNADIMTRTAVIKLHCTDFTAKESLSKDE